MNPTTRRHPHDAEVLRLRSGGCARNAVSTAATVHDYCRAADRFFLWLAGRGTPLVAVGMTDIDDVIAEEHTRGAWGRRTRHDYAQRLRAFFLFAETRGWCRAGLAAGIVAPRFMADETVPKGLRREDVVRLLASVGSDRPVDKRDRAILMLFIGYGLRTGEVGGLRLDDLDWENAMLRVRCPKPGRTDLWPLSQGVGHAILRYIREARPSGFGRNLFFTTHAPIRPLDRKALGKMIRDRLAGTGRRHRPTRGPRPSACRGPAPPGSGHVDEGDRGLPRPPRSVLHHDLRQGRSRLASRGGRSRPGGPGMTLRKAIERYVLWRQAHGAKFTTGASLLRRETARRSDMAHQEHHLMIARGESPHG